MNDADKEFNLYANLVIISVTIVVLFFLYRRNNRDLDDIESYDWSKFAFIHSGKQSFKKSETKDKPKQRVKEFSKGTGYIKEENRFPVLNEKTNDNYLTFEETNNFQDLINYAATMEKEKESTYPIESLYSQVMQNQGSNIVANVKIDQKINEILIR